MVQYSTFILFSNNFQILSENKCLHQGAHERSILERKNTKNLVTLLLSEKFRKIESFIKSGSFQPPCVNYGYVEKLPFLQTIFLAWLGFLIAVTRDNGKFLTICHTNLYIELCSRASTKLYHFMFLRSFLSRKWECFSAKNLT